MIYYQKEIGTMGKKLSEFFKGSSKDPLEPIQDFWGNTFYPNGTAYQNDNYRVTYSRKEDGYKIVNKINGVVEGKTPSLPTAVSQATVLDSLVKEIKDKGGLV